MNPLLNLLFEVSKVLVGLHPHLQPHIDAAEDFSHALERADPGIEHKAEKAAAAVVEDVIKDETKQAAEPADETAGPADEYTGDGKAAE